tara:strand:+ start:783 stop:3017 length:2235 start_codon:yes stop_codon:yes gene_type:complete
MGFFSSLFGSKRSSEPSSTVVQAQSIPKEVAPYLKEVLEGYQDLYRDQLERGYQEYGGETIAPLTTAQESALSGLEGLRGTTQPMYETAAERVTGAGQQFTPEAAQQYMSPYQQAVTDVELREAQRRFEGDVLPRLEAQAVNQGAMSGLGSRAGVEMAEAQRSQNQLLADIQAKGQQRAFEAASKQFEAERGRERMVGQDLAQLAGQGLTSQITELGAQKAVGEERQQLGQLNLDEAYRKYLEKQEFPETALTTYSGGVYGNPMSRTFDQTTNTFGAQPSTGQSLLSLGLSGLGMYGMGKNIYNKTAKEGGYVGQGLPTVYRQTNDQVGTGDDINARFKDAIQRGLIKPRDVDPNNVQQSIQNLLNNLSSKGIATSTDFAENAMQVDRTGIPYSLNKDQNKKLGEFMPGAADPMREFNRYSLDNPVSPKAILPGDIIDTSLKEMRQIDKESLDQRIKNLATKNTKEEDNSDISISAAMEQSLTDPSKITTNITTDITTDKTPKTASSSKSFLNDLISSNMKYNTMIDKKITSMGELQTQLKDAIEADKTGTKESRNRSNELAFWRSLLIAGGAVGAADPTKGFLNALAKGATAGGKSLVDARMKLEKEARGDGKKAIDAIKTLMTVETADLKLMQAGVDSKRKLVDSLAKWAKANNIKVDYKKLNAVATYSKNTVDSLGLDANDKRRAVAENLIKEKLTVYVANGMKGDFPTVTEAEIEERYKPTARVGGSNPKGKTADSVLDN